MASVADESKVAEKDKEIHNVQETEMQGLKAQQEREWAELRGENVSTSTDDSIMGLKQRLEEEKACRIAEIQKSREIFEK